MYGYSIKMSLSLDEIKAVMYIATVDTMPSDSSYTMPRENVSEGVGLCAFN